MRGKFVLATCRNRFFLPAPGGWGRFQGWRGHDRRWFQFFDASVSERILIVGSTTAGVGGTGGRAGAFAAPATAMVSAVRRAGCLSTGCMQQQRERGKTAGGGTSRQRQDWRWRARRRSEGSKRRNGKRSRMHWFSSARFSAAFWQKVNESPRKDAQTAAIRLAGVNFSAARDRLRGTFVRTGRAVGLCCPPGPDPIRARGRDGQQAGQYRSGSARGMPRPHQPQHRGPY